MLMTRRWPPYAVTGLILLISSWRVFALEIVDTLHLRTGSHLIYRYRQDYVLLLKNYFTEGFVRRGVAGTVFFPFRAAGPRLSLELFQLFCAILLCIPLWILLRRLARTEGRGWIWLALVLTLSPQLFMAWSLDIGRSDMLTAAVVAWALLACLSRRYLLAAVIIFIASQAHETGLIFGGPLCVAVGYLDYRAAKIVPAKAFVALGLLAALLVVAVAIQSVFGPTPLAIARDMLAHTTNDKTSEVTIFMTVAGFRSLVTSACTVYSYPQGYFYLASVFGVFALYGLVLPAFSRMRMGLYAFVGVLPLVFVSITAIDYGRWLSFAVFNWCLMNVALQLKNVDPLVIDRWPSRSSAVTAMAVLLMGPAENSYANKATGMLANHLWQDVPWERKVDLCDPTWRSLLYPKLVRQD